MTTSPGGRRPIPARHTRIARGVAATLARAGATPNGISLFGLAAGVGSGVLLALTAVLPGAAPALWIGAAGLVLLRGLSNMFDGMLAVEHGMKGPEGVLYNELPDRLSDLALLAGAGYSLGGSPTAGWLAACLAIFVAYVRAVGKLAGAPEDYGGPMAKQQRMFSVAGLACLLAVLPEGARTLPGTGTGLMAAWLWVLCLGSALTAALRIRRAATALRRTSSNG